MGLAESLASNANSLVLEAGEATLLTTNLDDSAVRAVASGAVSAISETRTAMGFFVASIAIIAAGEAAEFAEVDAAESTEALGGLVVATKGRSISSIAAETETTEAAV